MRAKRKPTAIAVAYDRLVRRVGCAFYMCAGAGHRPVRREWARKSEQRKDWSLAEVCGKLDKELLEQAVEKADSDWAVKKIVKNSSCAGRPEGHWQNSNSSWSWSSSKWSAAGVVSFIFWGLSSGCRRAGDSWEPSGAKKRKTGGSS